MVKTTNNISTLSFIKLQNIEVNYLNSTLKAKMQRNTIIKRVFQINCGYYYSNLQNRFGKRIKMNSIQKMKQQEQCLDLEYQQNFKDLSHYQTYKNKKKQYYQIQNQYQGHNNNYIINNDIRKIDQNYRNSYYKPIKVVMTKLQQNQPKKQYYKIQNQNKHLIKDKNYSLFASQNNQQKNSKQTQEEKQNLKKKQILQNFHKRHPCKNDDSDQFSEQDDYYKQLKRNGKKRKNNQFIKKDQSLPIPQKHKKTQQNKSLSTKRQVLENSQLHQHEQEDDNLKPEESQKKLSIKVAKHAISKGINFAEMQDIFQSNQCDKYRKCFNLIRKMIRKGITQMKKQSMKFQIRHKNYMNSFNTPKTIQEVISFISSHKKNTDQKLVKLRNTILKVYLLSIGYDFQSQNRADLEILQNQILSQESIKDGIQQFEYCFKYIQNKGHSGLNYK